MSKFIQQDFSGGMNLLKDDFRLEDTEYRYGSNIRSRFGSCKPVKAAEVVSSPAGIKQLLMTFDDYVLLCVAGKAYWRSRFDVGTWNLIAEFSMSKTAPTYFAEAVPIATMTSIRTRIDGTTIYGNVNYGNPSFVVAGTESGLVVQDGVSRPNLIYIDDNGIPRARRLADYGNWNHSFREYVPIMRQMVHHNSILYGVSADGKRILRSVTGRPLDFMVNIGTDGNKLPTEAEGGADSVSYSIGFNTIYALHALNTESLFVSTRRSCFAVTPNFERLVFGEPTFNKTYLFNATCLNQRSFIDILGDFAFIDSEGLRSFNAVAQEQNEGRNNIFSSAISPAFEDTRQDTANCSAIVFDNYAMFSVKTIYGNVIVVYDTLRKVFTSFDDTPNGYPIKQFAVIDTDVIELYGINTNDEVVKFFGDSYARGYVLTKGFTTGSPSQLLKSNTLRCIFIDCKEEGVTDVSQYVDWQLDDVSDETGYRSKTFEPSYGGILYNTPYPLLWQLSNTVSNQFYHFTHGPQGWKLHYSIGWTGGGSLSVVEVDAIDLTPKNPKK